MKVYFLIAVLITATQATAQAPQTPRDTYEEEYIYRILEPGMRAPTPVRKVQPDYSEQARSQHLEGSVTLSVVIDQDGLARDIAVKESLGSGLDEKAIEAVRKWKFTPATRKGKPVRFKVTIELNFRL